MKHNPEFIEKLYNMLEDNVNENYIRWNYNGLSFIIINPPEFAKCVLENHFKHGNLSSFVRQLNKYDFHKVKSSEPVIEAFGSQTWEFKNQYFQRGRRDLMFKIKRKRSSNERNFRSNTDLNSYGSESPSIMHHHIIGTIKVIVRYFQVIVEDLNEIKKIVLKERGFNSNQLQLNVLLEEDNITCSAFASAILKKMNCSVSVAENEDEMLTRFSNMKYDIILISLAVPNANVIIRTIRQYDNVTPLILIAGRLSKEECVEYLGMGVSEILIKPYQQETLVKLIQKYGEMRKKNGWSIHNSDANNDMSI